MYSNLYRPKNIDELSFNNNLSNKLKHIGLHNYIIHGCAGSGKLTRVYCQLADIFGKSVNNVKIEKYNLNKNLEITYKTSNYHIEINPSKYNTNDKNIICNFIGELAVMSNIITNSFKVFIIKDVDKLSNKAQLALKNIIDATYKTSKYILTSVNLNKVILSLKNRFILLRNPLPNNNEVINILKNISNKSGIKTSTRAINIIINNSINSTNSINLINIINLFQLSYITGKYSKYVINNTKYIDDLILVIDKKFIIDNINKIRELIYIIYVNNTNISYVISYITNYYIGIINDNFYKYKILELGAKYENKMQKGNKIPLYLETFILNIINVFMKNDITKTKTKIIKIKK